MEETPRAISKVRDLTHRFRNLLVELEDEVWRLSTYPSTESTCEATESADPEARAGIARLATQVWELEKQLGAPRKVWAVQVPHPSIIGAWDILGLADSQEGANELVALDRLDQSLPNREYGITEYEVHVDTR